MIDYAHCGNCGEDIDPEVYYYGTHGTTCADCWF